MTTLHLIVLGSAALIALVAIAIVGLGRARGWLRDWQRQASVVFTDDEISARIAADRSTRRVVMLFFASGIAWLLAGSALALLAAFRFQLPDLWSNSAWLTFGRVRPAHLNTVAYGWASLSSLGTAVWLVARLTGSRLRHERLALASVVLWNVAVLAGTIAILAGHSTGMEWLEFPRWVGVLLGVAGAPVGISIVSMVRHRSIRHMYVSLWYITAAVLWFPLLYTMANAPIWSGVDQAAMNWWFGHNVLGFWFTPIALAAGYYFIPKILGRPIYSYQLSLIGFWGLAFFYSLVGIHHLIGGPLPAWLISLSITASMLMVIPVVAVAYNHHRTAFSHLGTIRWSPTFRFIVFSAVSYTLVSVQGSIEAIRSFNLVVHFTHYTVGHAHLGFYAFVSMGMFGAMYYIMPRVAEWEWPYPKLISVHFWLSAIGISLYVVALSIGGWLQGKAQLDATRPFIDSVLVTLPYLRLRSVAGLIMTAAHVVLGYHFVAMVRHSEPARLEAAWAERRRRVTLPPVESVAEVAA